MSDNKKELKKDTDSSKVAKSGKKSDAGKSGKNKTFLDKVGKFFREYRSELKKISWPTFAEVVKNTLITMAMVLIVGVLIWVFDWGVSSLRDTLITAASRNEISEAIDNITSMGDASGSDISGTDISGTDYQALLDMMAQSTSNGDASN